MIDVALYEAVFNCMESLLPEYSAFGAVRGPGGSALPGIAPSNAYLCRDGYALVAGNGDSIYKRQMTAIGRDDLARDPALADNAGRVLRVEEIDGAIAAWTPSAAWPMCCRRWTPPPCRPAASTRWPTSPPTRTTPRAACSSRSAWTAAKRSRCQASIVPKLRAREVASIATHRPSARTPMR